MVRVCAHCGEIYPKKRPNCPACGADADLTLSEPGYDPDLDPATQTSLDEGSYEEFLRREGLDAGRAPGDRGPVSRGTFVLVLVTLAAAAVALWVLLL